MNEDAPTMSVGNGGFTGSAAATGPNAGVDPLMSSKPRRRKYKAKKKCECNEAVEDKAGYLPFLISYDGAESYISILNLNQHSKLNCVRCIAQKTLRS